MIRVALIILALGLTACSTAGGGSNMITPARMRAAALPDLGRAPELNNSIWLNTKEPLRLAALRGKVVGLEMWTLGCINCQRVIPHLKQWDAAYRERGLVLIGNHFPEFSYEANLDNLKEAVQQAGIRYAVAQDNKGETWNAYRNAYWPTLYLIDKRGHIRYVHIGEGAYDEIERNIEALISETYP